MLQERKSMADKLGHVDNSGYEATKIQRALRGGHDNKNNNSKH